ncbi:ZIP family metal transporter [Salinisphaera hydrothermalis]|uniref:ZIP family metal transporter n=1 Tax=Salinisphaera hydrothermalis TaxID=563188 RepID=UPI00333FE8AB
MRWSAFALALVWCAVMVLGMAATRDKLVVIGGMALLAMLAGWWLAERAVPAGARGLAIADGVVAGAMIASACVFLLPSALAGDPRSGGLGVAAGLILGISLDRLLRSHDPEHAGGDSALVAITLHASAAGAAMGLAYGAVPSLSVLLGVVIIAHKLPAGYALARARQALGRSRLPILAPSFAVGLVAIPVALWVGRSGAEGNTLLAGLATGIFLHVGLDFARPPVTRAYAGPSRFVVAAVLSAMAVAVIGLILS